MSRRALTMIALLLPLLLIATAASADPSFPLGERYRAGAYLAVRTDADLSTTGGLSVHFRSGAKSASTVAPMLVVGALDAPGKSFRALADDARLIGATTPDADLAAALFPGLKTEFVTLDLADPLPGPPMAWGAFDAVFLDAAAAARVTDEQVASLLVGGAVVAVRTGARPAGNAPWKQDGPWWVARLDVPRLGGVVQPDRYASLATPELGWPSNTRLMLVLALAAFSLAAISISLWRSRRAWIASVAVSIVAAVAIAFWWSRQPTVVRSDRVENFPAYADRWTQYAAVADGELRHPVGDPADLVWPVFFSKRHAAELQLRLECEPDGTPIAFVGRMRRGQSLTFLTRSIQVAPTPAPPASH